MAEPTLTNRSAVALAAMILMLCSSPVAVPAQDFSAGFVAGLGMTRGLKAELANGTSAEAGARGSGAFGFFFRDEMYRKVSGEFRYLYRAGAHEVKNDSGSAQLAAHSHLFHYDLLVHVTASGSRLRPYLALGAGGRIYQATGTPPRTQVLSNLVLLRKATETRPMISFGGGIRWTIAGKVVQFDLRDYATPAPRKVFAPSTTSTVSGWLHDFIPQVSVGVTF